MLGAQLVIPKFYYHSPHPPQLAQIWKTLNWPSTATTVPLSPVAPLAERGAEAVPGRDPGEGEPQAARQQLQLRQDRLHPEVAPEVGGVASVAEGAVHGEVLGVPHLRKEPGMFWFWVHPP